MKPSFLVGFALLVALQAGSLRAEDRVIYTFIEPSCCSAPSTHLFSLDAAKAASLATENAYQPDFSVKPGEAIEAVRKYLAERHPGADKFLVFECTLGWYGITQPDRSIKGFQYAFVRSEIHAPPPAGLKFSDPNTAPSRIVYPSYELVLADGTILEGRIAENK